MPPKTIATSLANKLKMEDIANIFNNRNEDGSYEWNLHRGKISPYDWITSKSKKMINHINFFFWSNNDKNGIVESHFWFYKVFWNYLNPEYCQVVHAGTIPLRNSISNIWKYMDNSKNVGAVWGEIEIYNPTDKDLGYPK